MVRRCDEAERRIKFMEALYPRFKINLPSPDNINEFLQKLKLHLDQENQDALTYFEKAEEDLINAEKSLIDQLKEYDTTTNKLTSVEQHKFVLNRASQIVCVSARY
jgi:hemerythrin-like domain-containing protein